MAHPDFFAAIKAGDLTQVQRMLADDPSLVNAKDENGLSAVLTAAYYQEPATAKLLAERGAVLNVFEACAVGELPQVQALIAQQPALINASAPDGFQPLGLAAFFGHMEVVEYLLKHGAEVNSASKNDMRVMPLHSAVATLHKDIIRLLLEHGADVNVAQAGDITPLHEAAQNGQAEVAQMLIAHGANVNAKSTDGKTPLAIALEYRHDDIAGLLRKHGAVE